MLQPGSCITLSEALIVKGLGLRGSCITLSEALIGKGLCVSVLQPRSCNISDFGFQVEGLSLRIEYWALGMGYGVWGMGYGVLGIGLFFTRRAVL